MERKNHYETAFKLWLEDKGYAHSHISQTRRLKLTRQSVKSFDYIIDAPGGSFVVELKGRKFRGSSLENLRGLQNWVTADDVEGLGGWQTAAGAASGLFVFCYQLSDYFADTDAHDTIELDGTKYAFIAITLDDYKTHMKPRSPRWQTVYLQAKDFRAIAKRVTDVLDGHNLTIAVEIPDMDGITERRGRRSVRMPINISTLDKLPQRKLHRLKNHDYSSNGYYFVTICTHHRQHILCDIIGDAGDIRNAGNNRNAGDGVPYNGVNVIPTEIGKMVIECWDKISTIDENIYTDFFCVMPDHIHGIIVINNQPAENMDCNTINRDELMGTQWRGQCEGTQGRGQIDDTQRGGRFDGTQRRGKFDGTERRGRRSLQEIIRGFKSVTTRLYKKMGETALWQKSYYEHIIRNENDYNNVAEYIANNPARWHTDHHKNS